MSAALEPVQSVAEKIVRAGYRALALKNHPDHGGSSSAMAAINRAKDWLDEIIGSGRAPRGSSDPNEWFWEMADRWEANAAKTRAERAERTRRRETEDEFRRRKEEERRQAETYRIDNEWVHLYGVSCVNQNPNKICCAINRKIVWIPRTEVRLDSAVQHRGDIGTLTIKLWLARRLGIVAGG